MCAKITNIPCFQRALVSNMRLNFNQSFDKTEPYDDAGVRVSGAQERVRHGPSAVPELRQANVSSAHDATLGRAFGFVRVQMRRVRSVGERICRRAPSRLICGSWNTADAEAPGASAPLALGAFCHCCRWRLRLRDHFISWRRAAATSPSEAAIDTTMPAAHGRAAATANSQVPIAGPAASLRSLTTPNAA